MREGGTEPEIGARLGDVIQARTPDILFRWELGVRQLRPARELPEPALREQLPRLLDRLAAVVRAAREGGSPSMEDLPGIHALARLDTGCDLNTVLQELSILRKVILEVWTEHAGEQLWVPEIFRLNQALETVVTSFISHFAEARDRTLKALDRISAAALGKGDLDTLLPELLLALQETSAACDTVTILLRDQDGAMQVRATVGLGEALRFRVSGGDGFAGTIAATGRPLMLRDAAHDPLVRNPHIREKKVRALYGIPLEHAGEIIGVAHFGSLTAYEFSLDDQQLFRAVARRATSLIVQAQLMEREREVRQEAQKTLALLDTVLSAAPVGIVFFDRELRYVRINDSLAKVNGKPVEAHLGRTVREVLPEVADVLEPPLRRILETEQPLLNAEFTAAPPSTPEEQRSFLGNHYPVKTPDGAVVGIGGVIVEVTELKRAEQAAREGERQFEALAENIPQLAWMADETGSMFWFNRRWFDYTGITLDALRGQGWQRLHHPDHLGRVTEKFRHHLETGEVWEDTFPLRGKDGQYRWFLSRAVPIRDEHGKIWRWFGTNTDVTAQREVQEELRRAVELKDTFVGVVGHDLRNPLSVIRATASLMLKSVGDNERLHRQTLRILGATDRMARMIEEVLDFVRGRLGGGIPVQRRRMDMATVCAGAVEEARATHPGRDIRYQVEGDTVGQWDEGRVAQVIGNLLGNAVKHGDPDAPIRVSIRGRDAEVTLEVHNEGAPIPPGLRPTLFEPFRQGRGHGREGLGLGLFIVKEIVSAHGGSIELRSSQGEGTTFTVTWPRAAAPHG